MIFGWHEHEYHDVAVSERLKWYVWSTKLPMHNITRHLCFPTPRIVPYHSGLLLHPTAGALRDFVWADRSFLTGILIPLGLPLLVPIRCAHQFEVLPLVNIFRFAKRSFWPPLPFAGFPGYFIRRLGIQNIVRGTEYLREHVDILLRYVSTTLWSHTPGLLGYEYEVDTFSTNLLHPAGNENTHSYPARQLVSTPYHPRRWRLLEINTFNRWSSYPGVYNLRLQLRRLHPQCIRSMIFHLPDVCFPRGHQFSF